MESISSDILTQAGDKWLALKFIADCQSYTSFKNYFILTDFKSRKVYIHILSDKWKWINCFSPWVCFLLISSILTILAVAVEETFKTTIISIGGQDCSMFAELCVSVPAVLCVAVGTEQAGCREPHCLAHSLTGTWHLG